MQRFAATHRQHVVERIVTDAVPMHKFAQCTNNVNLHQYNNWSLYINTRYQCKINFEIIGLYGTNYMIQIQRNITTFNYVYYDFYRAMLAQSVVMPR